MLNNKLIADKPLRSWLGKIKAPWEKRKVESYIKTIEELASESRTHDTRILKYFESLPDAYQRNLAIINTVTKNIFPKKLIRLLNILSKQPLTDTALATFENAIKDFLGKDFPGILFNYKSLPDKYKTHNIVTYLLNRSENNYANIIIYLTPKNILTDQHIELALSKCDHTYKILLLTELPLEIRSRYQPQAIEAAAQVIAALQKNQLNNIPDTIPAYLPISAVLTRAASINSELDLPLLLHKYIH